MFALCYCFVLGCIVGYSLARHHAARKALAEIRRRAREARVTQNMDLARTQAAVDEVFLALDRDASSFSEYLQRAADYGDEAAKVVNCNTYGCG
jgi:hypothetical protein